MLAESIFVIIRMIMSQDLHLLEALSPKLRISDDDRLEMVRKAVENGADINSSIFPVHIAVKNGWLKIVKYLVEKNCRLDLRNTGKTVKGKNGKTGGKTVIELLKRKLKQTKLDNRQVYAEIFRKVDPVGFKNMERNHARTEMGKKYEALVFIQLLMVGRRKFTKSDFKIGRQVKTRETINQKFDDVVFCYSESNRKKNITFQVKHCSKSKTLKSTNFNQRNDDFGLEKYFISYLDLQYDIQRISGNNSVEKSQENFRDREIEFLVIFTSADIDLDDLAKNNYKYNLDEPPGIADFCIKIEENEPPKFFSTTRN